MRELQAKHWTKCNCRYGVQPIQPTAPIIVLTTAALQTKQWSAAKPHSRTLAAHGLPAPPYSIQVGNWKLSGEHIRQLRGLENFIANFTADMPAATAIPLAPRPDASQRPPRVTVVGKVSGPNSLAPIDTHLPLVRPIAAMVCG